MTSEDILNLKALLEQMRQEDPDFRVFGSEQHQYLLGPTRTEEELQAFEATHGIRLPEDYRLFLKEAGDGSPHPKDKESIMQDSGAGPYYGLVSLEEAAKKGRLNERFPLTESTDDLSEEALNAFLASIEDGARMIPGALKICQQGSGFESYLIVNGPAYGMIWDGLDSYWPTGLSFSQWYSTWLARLRDDIIPCFVNERRVVEVKIGMSLQEVIRLYGTPAQKQMWDHGKEKWHISFEGLATEFALDENEQVVRIIPYPIH